MKDCNLKEVVTPVQKIADPLTELLRDGARDLIKQAVEAELGAMLSDYADLKLSDGRQAVVRNGYLPERTIQTGIGDVIVKVPKVRDRSGSGIHFGPPPPPGVKLVIHQEEDRIEFGIYKITADFFSL